MRFDLKFALLLMTNLCVLAWASTADHPFAWMAYVTFVQLTAALYAVAKETSPFPWATISGLIALAALGICLGPVSTLVYLIFGVPGQPPYQDFFEDGIAFAIFAPLFLVFLWIPFSCAIGFVIAVVMRGIQRGVRHGTQ